MIRMIEYLYSEHLFTRTSFMHVTRLIFMLLPLTPGGCLSFSSSNPRPPANNTTIVVPPGSTVVCSNGAGPPCR
jgi:hypothetical protein